MAYIPYEERTGAESTVYFTKDLSAEGLCKIFDRIGAPLQGKVAIKLHTGEPKGPNLIPRPWVKELLTEKVTLKITVVEGENESIVEKTFDRGFLTMHGSASLKGLTIKSVYTTQNEDSSNFGALTLTCEAEDGTEIVLRTIVLKDSAGKTITADAFPVGSKVNARGVVDVYNGEYQLKVFSANDITFIN